MGFYIFHSYVCHNVVHMAQRIVMSLNDKLFWDIVHYKVHVPTGIETNISVKKGVHVNTAKRIKLKAQRSGYRYSRVKREYKKVIGDIEYHLIFA